MALSTFDELKDEIEDHLDRNDLSGNIETFIRLAESRMERDIRIREMITRSTATLTDRFLELPDDFVGMRTLRLLTDPVTVLEEINLHEMNRIRNEGNGKPEWFTVHEEIEFNKTPDENYTSEMIYYAKFPALSDSNQTNGLLDRAPDAYLYGSLIAAEPFLMNDERLQVWSQLYQAAVNKLNAMDVRRAGPLRARTVGSTP